MPVYARSGHRSRRERPGTPGDLRLQTRSGQTGVATCAARRWTRSTSAPAPTAASRTCGLRQRFARQDHQPRRAGHRLPGHARIYRQALAEGLIKYSWQAGFCVTNPTCGACLGMSNGVLAEGEVCAATTNRNFNGRMGKGGMVHLMSPATAAATAIAGTSPRPATTGNRELDHEKFQRKRPVSGPVRHQYRRNHPGQIPHRNHQGSPGPHLLEDLCLEGFIPGTAPADKQIVVTRANFGCGQFPRTCPLGP
jgi:hypothetical protein